MHLLTTFTLLMSYAHFTAAQCSGYPCDTLWYDENGKLKDEFVVTDIRFELGKTTLVHFGTPHIDSIFIVGMHQKLDSLATVLAAHSGSFEIQCHLDCRGSDQMSSKPSQRRAKAVCDYLTAKGVGPGKLLAKGYGDVEPRKISEAGQEITLTCEYIQRFKESDKTYYEQLHQYNRRIVVKRIQ